MDNAGLSGAELLQWNDESAAKWEAFLGENPAILELTCDIAKTKTVAELLQHIVAVELRYAQRLSDDAVTPYEEIAFGSVAEIFATHRRAVELYRAKLADTSFDWAKMQEFQTRMGGDFKATPRKILVHALLHSIRHYAQLATLVRQHGYKPGWMMDLLASSAMP